MKNGIIKDVSPGLRLTLFLAIILAFALLGMSMTWWFLWQDRAETRAQDVMILHNQAVCQASKAGLDAVKILLDLPVLPNGQLTRADVIALQSWVKQINDGLYASNHRSAQTAADVAEVLAILHRLDLRMIQKIPQK